MFTAIFGDGVKSFKRGWAHSINLQKFRNFLGTSSGTRQWINKGTSL
jgi:hypothetical protein